MLGSECTMNANTRRTLLYMLANLDQMNAGIELIHSACIHSELEPCADEMREKVWEMLAVVEASLKNSRNSADRQN